MCPRDPTEGTSWLVFSHLEARSSTISLLVAVVRGSVCEKNAEATHRVATIGPIFREALPQNLCHDMYPVESVEIYR